MQTLNFFNQSLPNIMLLFHSGTAKNSCSHLSVTISYFNAAHPSTSMSHHLPIEEMHLVSFVLVFLLESYIPLYEEVILQHQKSNKA